MGNFLFFFNLFYTSSKQDKLDPRLDARVDTMLLQGMLREMMEIHEMLHREQPAALKAHKKASSPSPAPLSPSSSTPTNAKGPTLCGFDCCLGLLQNIGFKEFEPYFTKLHELQADDDDTGGGGGADDGDDANLRFNNRIFETAANHTAALHTQFPELKLCYEKCLEHMKLATRQYARKQRSWISNRLVPASGKTDGFTLFKLDASDLSRWDELVLRPAQAVLLDIMNGRALSVSFNLDF